MVFTTRSDGHESSGCPSAQTVARAAGLEVLQSSDLPFLLPVSTAYPSDPIQHR
jgi:hypothetical protein